MKRTCILIADRMRARIFEADPLRDNKYHRYHLEEKIDLHNIWSPESLLFRSEPRRDDRISRQPEEEHNDRVFAKEVCKSVQAYLSNLRPDCLIMIAPPHFLGALRKHEYNFLKEVPDILEIPKDLSRLRSRELRDYLEDKILT